MESVAVASEWLALAKQSPISVRQPSDSPLHAIRLLAHGAEDADMGHLTSEQVVVARWKSYCRRQSSGIHASGSSSP